MHCLKVLSQYSLFGLSESLIPFLLRLHAPMLRPLIPFILPHYSFATLQSDWIPFPDQNSNPYSKVQGIYIIKQSTMSLFTLIIDIWETS